MNVILVIFDSLRKDCVGAYGQPPWGKVHTPNFDAFARDCVLFTNVWPESLPTLPTRRAVYTGNRVYPFHNGDFALKGDFVGAPGWGPIPEEQDTLGEMLQAEGYRTALVSDVYHQFKPSKNYWRGFDQWVFLRGQETDPYRSGPRLTQEELDYWLPPELRNAGHQMRERFVEQCVMNYYDRKSEEEFFSARVLRESALWLEQNRDAEQFFLTVESFDPHEPWLPPAYYREMYLKDDGPENIVSVYGDGLAEHNMLLRRTQANYSGEVTMCDRWFGYFVEQLRVMGLLENTMVVLTSDHGHSIGDLGFTGKRGYPSHPSVYEIPLMIRFPSAEYAGQVREAMIQHHDITATVLDWLGVDPPQAIDGRSFLEVVGDPARAIREHATVGWGSAVTVIADRWWYNAKIDGTGALLHDRTSDRDCVENVAARHPETVRELQSLAETDAVGGYPDWLMKLAREQVDAPGCSALAAR